ncbi:cyclic nucleotide-binding domain-containing protein, partial [Methylicorpusculum sp.]|uniref:cyclic nucleotide-binding domain-containing protein n=1 Tax=Methylicorpusculum sp. TaxID=2713644 RepID=UPI002AB9F6CA
MNLFSQENSHKEALEQFLTFCHKKAYPSKVTIIRSGDTADNLYFIVDGSVTICAEDTNGQHELVLAYLNKNDFIGEIGVFKGAEIRKVSVKTREACHLAQISYDRFRQLLKKELLPYAPELLFMLGEQLATRLLLT